MYDNRHNLILTDSIFLLTNIQMRFVPFENFFGQHNISGWQLPPDSLSHKSIGAKRRKSFLHTNHSHLVISEFKRELAEKVT